MAEDFSDIVDPMEYHPCDTPRGMLYYNMEILTDEQQTKLNTLKLETLRENHRYLAGHPEIRACIAIILRLVMKQRPRTNIYEVIAEYFSKSRVDIEAEIEKYISEKKCPAHESLSGLDLYVQDEESYISESIDGEIRSSASAEGVPQTIYEDWEAWKDDLPDLDPTTLQMRLPGSLRNLDINFDKIPNWSPEAVIHSISMVAQGAEDEDAKVARARINAHVSNYLARLAKEAHGDEVEGDEPYTGHVPVMEDYVKLQKKRQTFVADVDSEEVMEYFQKATSVGEMGKGSVVFMEPGIASSTSSTPSKERPGGSFAKKISSRNLRRASIRSLTFEKEQDHSQRLDVTPDEDFDPKLKPKPDKTISFHIVSEPEEPSSHPNVLFQDGDESLASGYNTASGATTTSERSSVTSGSVRIDGSNAGEPSTDTSISGVTAENSATVVSEEDVANRENATIEGIPVEEFVNGEQTESVQNGAGSEEVGNAENFENTANTDTNAIAE